MNDEDCGCRTCGDCPLEAGMKHLAGQWKTMLIFRLLEKPRRFSELKRILPGISDQVLHRQLTTLMVAEVIVKILPNDKKRPEYHLTEFGAKLKPALEVIFEWGSQALANATLKEKQRNAPENETAALCAPV